MDDKKTFQIETYTFICGLIEYMGRVSTELSGITDSTYEKTFKESVNTFNRISAQIGKFLDKWVDDDDKICSSLKTIKEYNSLFCKTLINSFLSAAYRDSKYIIDSIQTAKLMLLYKLKKIKNEL